MLTHDYRVERTITIPRNLNGDRTDSVSEHRFRTGPVTRITPVTAKHVMLVVAEMISDLFVSRCLKDTFCQRSPQPGRTHRRTLLASLPHQIPRQLKLLRRLFRYQCFLRFCSTHSSQYFGHHDLPHQPHQEAGVSSHLHQKPDRPNPHDRSSAPTGDPKADSIGAGQFRSKPFVRLLIEQRARLIDGKSRCVRG